MYEILLFCRFFPCATTPRDNFNYNQTGNLSDLFIVWARRYIQHEVRMKLESLHASIINVIGNFSNQDDKAHNLSL